MADHLLYTPLKVGPNAPQADGTTVLQGRVGKTGETIVSYGHGKYHEAVSRGNCFYASNQAEITFGTALTATAVTFTLYNPLGSTVNLSVLWCGITIRTASTPGHVVYAVNNVASAAIPATNTLLTCNNAKMGGVGGQGVAYSITTLPAAPTAIRTLACSSGTAAGPNQIQDFVDGGILLTPNTAVTIQGITIVGTGIVSMLWEEISNVA